MRCKSNAELREARGRVPCWESGALTWLRVLTVSFLIWFVFAIRDARAAPMPRYWHAPPAFLQAVLCLHHYEGAWNANTGNGYYGGLQFMLSTWRRAGGTGYPHQWSPREQIYRCWRIWLQDGRSFREWGTAARCGLR